MKTWKPDTCGCCVEEIYDGNTLVGGGQVLTKCPAHASVADAELYGVLYANPDGENKRKNLVHAMLLGVHAPELNLGLAEANAKGSPEFKAGAEYVWSFTGEGKGRVLNVGIPGASMTPLKKANFHSSCEAQFGQGKVVMS